MLVHAAATLVGQVQYFGVGWEGVHTVALIFLYLDCFLARLSSLSLSLFFEPLRLIISDSSFT